VATALPSRIPREKRRGGAKKERRVPEFSRMPVIFQGAREEWTLFPWDHPAPTRKNPKEIKKTEQKEKGSPLHVDKPEL